MEIWYDPSSGQVMALYSTRYTGTVWPDAGYLRAETDLNLTRDYRVTVSKGRVESATPRVNPSTPPQNSDGVAEARAAARAAVVESIVEAELAKSSSAIPEIETLRTALGESR